MMSRVAEEQDNSLHLREETKNLFQAYDKELETNKDLQLVKNLVTEYTNQPFPASFFRRARDFSHNTKVLVDGEEKLVDELANNYNDAIAYNASYKNFNQLKKGEKSTIIPENYLSALSVLLQEEEFEEVPSKEETGKILKNFFRGSK